MKLRFGTWQEVPAYGTHSDKLESLQAKIDALEQAEEESSRERQAAIERLGELEALAELGRGSERELKAARNAVDSLKPGNNGELAKLRRAASILEAELPGLEDEAKQTFCSQFTGPYAEVMRGLLTALDKSQEAYKAVQAVVETANGISPDKATRLKTGAHNPELPELCGLPQTLGVDFFRTPEGSVWNDGKPASPYANWKASVEAYLN